MNKRKKVTGRVTGGASPYLQRFQHALSLHRAGKLAAAEQDYVAITKAFPAAAEVFHALGVLYFQQGHLDNAAKAVEQALSQDANNPAFLLDMGRIQRKRQQFSEAQSCFERVLAVSPDTLPALSELGTLLFSMGELAQAAQRFRAALKQQPNNLFLRNCLAKTEFERFELASAKAIYEETQRLAPSDSASLLNLVTIYRVLGELSTAKALFQKRIDAAPDNLELRLQFGRFLTLIGDEDAEPVLRGALAQDPNSVPVRLQLYHALKSRQPSEARALLEQTAQRAGELPEIKVLRATALVKAGQGAEADELYRQAIKHNPNDLALQSTWAFTSNYLDDLSPEQLLQRHRLVGQRYPQQQKTQPFSASGYSGGAEDALPLRIGYISPDLHQHSVSSFVEPLLRGHDRRRVSVTCYSDSTCRDAINSRLRTLADHWVDIAGVSDAGVRQRIMADQIDILVELAGHSANNRLALMAEGAAPVQVTYLGYCNTTGIPSIQYRISDEVADPPGVGEQQNSETLLRLEGGFLCYQPDIEAPALSDLPALTAGFVRFGCFNNLAKLSDRALRLWGRLLQQLPDARLTLKAQGLEDAQLQSLVRQRCDEAGLDNSRVDLWGQTESKYDHLQLYNQIDIGLDSLPYNGTTTTCEALWMGVPVLCLRGDRHASRVGASLMSQVDLDEWVVDSEEQLLVTAVAMARDLSTLATLRAGMRERMQASSLLDQERICRELERHYQSIWYQAQG